MEFVSVTTGGYESEGQLRERTRAVKKRQKETVGWGRENDRRGGGCQNKRKQLLHAWKHVGGEFTTGKKKGSPKSENAAQGGKDTRFCLDQRGGNRRNLEKKKGGQVERKETRSWQKKKWKSAGGINCRKRQLKKT